LQSLKEQSPRARRSWTNEVGTTITCKGGNDIPCVMKAVHYLRYYENKSGIRLPEPEIVNVEPWSATRCRALNWPKVWGNTLALHAFKEDVNFKLIPTRLFIGVVRERTDDRVP
jgi:hypothetical protein